MQINLSQAIYSNLTNTIIATFVLALSYALVNFLMLRKIDSNRQRRNFRIRSFYVVCVIFMFVMARIWVEGFTHLLAVLGLVSAALVVTNKETIMNFVGCLIITWRELFAENDLIQIQQYKGYVKSIGVLYFSLAEISDGVNGNITGRVIRVPNGLIANNALINFSQTSHLLEQKFSFTITQDSDIVAAMDFIGQLVKDTVKNLYKEKKEFSIEYISKKNKNLIDRINLDPNVSIHLKVDKPAGVELITRYYCFSQDAEKLQQQIWLSLFESLKNEQQIKLAYTT